MPLIDLTGKAFGRLTVLRRAHNQISPSGQSHPRWEVLCSCGTRTTVLGQSLRCGSNLSCGCLRTELITAIGHRNAKEAPAYSSVHIRVNRVRGPAKDHPCAWCQKPAKSWAYLHTDPEELTEFTVLASGTEAVFHYSTDPSQYVPLCKSCHGSFDKQQKRARTYRPEAS